MDWFKEEQSRNTKNTIQYKMKTQNQDMIQQLMDEGEYAPLYPFVLQSKLTDLQKLLVTLMLNDIRMNGWITWKQSTYADKLGKSRKTLVQYFKMFTESGIIIPEEGNKPGSKSNRFTISFSAIEDFKPVTPQSKPVTSQSKPVTLQSKPVTLQSKPVTPQSKPVTPRLHIKKLKETNKESNKEIIKKVKGEDTSFLGFMKGAEDDKPKDELEEFLEEFDI